MDVVLAPGEAAPLRIHALELFLYKRSTDATYRGPARETGRELALGSGMRHVEALQLGHLPTVEPWREALARLHGPGAPRLPRPIRS